MTSANYVNGTTLMSPDDRVLDGNLKISEFLKYRGQHVSNVKRRENQKEEGFEFGYRGCEEDAYGSFVCRSRR